MFFNCLPEKPSPFKVPFPKLQLGSTTNSDPRQLFSLFELTPSSGLASLGKNLSNGQVPDFKSRTMPKKLLQSDSNIHLPNQRVINKSHRIMTLRKSLTRSEPVSKILSLLRFRRSNSSYLFSQKSSHDKESFKKVDSMKTCISSPHKQSNETLNRESQFSFSSCRPTRGSHTILQCILISPKIIFKNSGRHMSSRNVRE
jgi:hypothetical protein